MKRKKILGSHVKRLLSGVAIHGRRHLTEVETDLLQTELLLEEAIDKLTSSFMAIHSAVGARQEAIDRLLAGEKPSAEDSARLSDMSGEETPTYRISFKLYAMGITRDLVMDYGDFSMTGTRVDLALFDAPESCVR